MEILLKGVKIIDPHSPFHLQTNDVFIQAGHIAGVGTIDRPADETINIPGLHLSPGWTDTFAHFCDPGYEANETLQTGALAAAYGGYTDVLVVPNTLPAVDTKSGVEYLVQHNKSLPVTIHPLAAITKNAQGKELAEMYDMHAAGAVAFTDGLRPLQSPGVLLKALQYLKAVNGTIVQLPDDVAISAHGLMNESIVSTRLGLPGQPALAEELMVMRDIELVKYTGAKIHFTGISTAKSVSLIREAKAAKLPVTCSVTPYHLYFTDEELDDYDSNFKVNPPLRTAADRAALRTAVMDGTVDCIASHHLPQHSDNKMVEFEYAKNGMTGLETTYSVLRTSIPELTSERLVNLLSLAPRAIFGLQQPSIAVNTSACLSLFHPDVDWTPIRLYSKSKNSPFINRTLKGKPAGIINKDSLFLKP